MIRSCIKYGFREWGLSFFERNKIFSWKSRVNRGAISDDFPIRHKTITLHRHQKDFLDKLVVKKNSLKETFKQRKLLRTRFGKKHIREEFLPWKSKLCSCVSSFFSWQVWFVQNWNVRGFLRWTETSFFLNFIYTT